MRVMSKPAASILGASTAACLAAWAMFPLPDALRVGLLDFLWVAVCWSAAAAAWIAARLPQNGRLRTSLLFLGGASFCWGGGQLVWAYHEVIAHTEPFPSLADVGFIATAPLVAAAILTWPGAVVRRPLDRWAAPAVAAVLAALAGFELLVEPVAEPLPTSFAGWLAVAYPVADLFLLAALVLVFGLEGTEERGRLLVVAFGVLSLLGADALFAQAPPWAGLSSELSNLLFTLAFAAFGVVGLLRPATGALRKRVSEASTGAFLAALILLVMVKEFFEDRAWSHTEAWDSLVFGLVVVALVWLSWKAASVLYRAQERLAHETALRQATMDASRTGTCVFTVDGERAFWNTTFTDVLGITPDRCASWGAFVGYLQTLAAANGGAIIAAPGERARCWTAYGRFVEIRVDAIATGETLVSADDFTHQEREAATRARFVAEVVGAQEAEARRIAGLLHDDAVQQLTALALRLELTAMQTGDGSLDHLATQANGVTSSLRRLLVQLHPVVLESQGLGAAIDVAAAGLRSAGVAVTVDPYDDRHPIETEQLAYRVVQEAFANTLKHARAEQVDVRLRLEDGVLHCTVTDDGIGFDLDDLETAIAEGHLGLHLIRERIDLGGGEVDITSEPGSGTTVSFTLPTVPAYAFEGAAA